MYFIEILKKNSRYKDQKYKCKMFFLEDIVRDQNRVIAIKRQKARKMSQLRQRWSRTSITDLSAP